MAYLEALKAKGLMTDVHLSLLLTCYVRMKDEERIGELLSEVFELVLPPTDGSGEGSCRAWL